MGAKSTSIRWPQVGRTTNAMPGSDESRTCTMTSNGEQELSTRTYSAAPFATKPVHGICLQTTYIAATKPCIAVSVRWHEIGAVIFLESKMASR